MASLPPRTMPRVTHPQDSLETLRLEDETTGAVVHVAPARGGMITRFSVGDAAVLFLDETTLRDPSKSVRGGIPVLFPIAGKLPGGHYEVNGRTYAMKQHGFARDLPWTVIDESTADGASVTLALEATEATREVYPFQFAVRFTYRLRGGALLLEQSFENRGGVPMPIQPGLHPYFLVPDVTKAGVRIETDATRGFDNRTGREVPVQQPIALVGQEVDLFLLNHTPRTTTLHRPGQPAVRLDFGDDQRVLVVWTLPARDFVCVEPWRAPGGALASGTAPYVAPGTAARTTLRVSLA
jgi:galactose mutarotase-like enzyme